MSSTDRRAIVEVLNALDAGSRKRAMRMKIDKRERELIEHGYKAALRDVVRDIGKLSSRLARGAS